MTSYCIYMQCYYVNHYTAMHFSLAEIITSMMNFHHKIGKGAFGIVYKGTNFMGTGTVVAVKKLSKVF